MSSTLGNKIKALRLNIGLTQEKVAEKAGIPYATLIKIENDHIANPTIITIYKLASALGVSIDELVKGTEILDNIKNLRKN